ncbi:MAG: carbohydrate-binding domain-containing protein, partial [Eubacteriales bacterium]|nr:carbohydrate-binding domain-containing protein [Eubacteriales bacterium]
MKRIIVSFITVSLVITSLFLTPVDISAAEPHRETVNLLNVTKNQSGEGYYWHNPSKTLTLNGLHIDTQSKFGLRLLDNTIVVLEGKNIISAAETAIQCIGTVTFKGTGSLTIKSGDTGILIQTENRSKKMMILDGVIDISAGREAIRSDIASISVAGGNISLSAAAAEGYAINGNVVSISDGVTLTADNTIAASYSLTINAANMTVNAPKSALEYAGTFGISNVSLSVGTSPSALSEAETFGGEASIVTLSTADKRQTSIIFGADYPLALDFVALAGLLAVLAAVIFIPPYVKKRK